MFIFWHHSQSIMIMTVGVKWLYRNDTLKQTTVCAVIYNHDMITEKILPACVNADFQRNGQWSIFNRQTTAHDADRQTRHGEQDRRWQWLGETFQIISLVYTCTHGSVHLLAVSSVSCRVGAGGLNRLKWFHRFTTVHTRLLKTKRAEEEILCWSHVGVHSFWSSSSSLHSLTIL